MSIMFLPLRLIPSPVRAVVLSTVLRLFFSRDASLTPMLEALEGRSFHIHVRDLKDDYHMGFYRGQPWVHPGKGDDVDVHIDATTSGFARLCFARENPDDLICEHVLILSGDSEAMLRFKQLLAAADIDWEAELRGAFGDYFGSNIAKAAQALLKAEDSLTRTSRTRMDQCILDMQIPTGQRMQTWQTGVEEATRRLKRLNTRLAKLEKQMPGSNP